MSFTPIRNWNTERYLSQFIGSYNYYRIYHMVKYDPIFRQVMINTIIFVLITLIVNVFGGLLISLATYFINEKSSSTLRLVWLLPRMSPIAVYSLVWYYFFHGSEIGTLNSLLLKLGIIDKPIVLGQGVIPWGPWSIIVFINGLVGVSFGMIVFSSALSHIPRELVIAARVDGATNWSISRKILIPMIRWHILYVFTWQLLSLITSYAHTFLLIEWGLVNRDYGTTLSLYVFLTAFGRGEQDQGLAAAAATILAIIGTVLGFLTLKILKFERMIAKPRGDI
jgi:inositol-phosphate transport system permease protein